MVVLSLDIIYLYLSKYKVYSAEDNNNITINITEEAVLFNRGKQL